MRLSGVRTATLSDRTHRAATRGIDIPLEVHIVSKLKDLKDDETWKVVMKSKRRKTLVVCPECHKQIHVE